MKTKVLFILMILVARVSVAQVAINSSGSSADNSAMLDVSSTSKGVLVPRMTTAQRGAISSPATGLLVFDTDENNFFFYNGVNWVLLKSGTVNWNLDSISLTVADTNYRVGVGTTTPSGRFEVATIKHNGTYGSDLCSGGMASASSYYQTYTPDRAFDDQTATEWLSDNSLPGYLQYDFGEGNNKRIAKYRIYYEHPSSYDHSPSDWTFEASNDGSTWTTLDTQTGQGWSSNGWKEYTFSNTTHYRYYRIHITDNAGSWDNYVQINETEMMEENLSNNTTLFVNDNKVGIGTSSPSATLDISGTMKLADGNEGSGKILVSDASGNAGWANGTTVNGGGWTVNGNYIYETDDSVGIGTSSPDARLTVNGRISQTGTGNSVFLGEGAGENDDLTGNMNTFVGYESGKANTSGNSNSAFGYSSLYSNTTGFNNAAFGYGSLYSNTTGKNIAGFGAGSLVSNMTGYSNVAIGTAALNKSSDRHDLVAVGDSALFNNGVGASSFYANWNTAVGSKALYSNTTGFSNTAAGFQALYKNETGHGNTATGYQALYSDSTGIDNAANGYKALYSNTTGSYNTAMGSYALNSNTTGYSNIAIGYGALHSNQTANTLVAIGDSALYNNTNTGYVNTAVGSKALYSNTTGDQNTAVGFNALYSNTTKADNTAVGYKALYSNGTGGDSNTAIGSKSLLNNTGGALNTAVGANSLISNTTGFANVSIGYETMFHNWRGVYNIAMGYRALYVNDTGSYNTALGFEAYVLNSHSNSTALGAYSSITASNQVRIGDNTVTSIGGYANWTNLSDKRFKRDVRYDVPGLDFILKLKPVTYHLDLDKLNNFLNIPDSVSKAGDFKIESMKKKEAMVQTGFLAQDVEKAAEAVGYDFSGVDKPKNEHDFYGLRYAEFVVPLVKAVQEQQRMITELQNRIKQQDRTIQKMQRKIENLKK